MNQKELDPKMKIYLLTAPGASDWKTTVGFQDLGTGRSFTFAFSSPEKLKDFVEHQKGALEYAGKEIRTWWVTIEEYFRNPQNHQLIIDPPNDFQSGFDLPNAN